MMPKRLHKPQNLVQRLKHKLPDFRKAQLHDIDSQGGETRISISSRGNPPSRLPILYKQSASYQTNPPSDYTQLRVCRRTVRYICILSEEARVCKTWYKPCMHINKHFVEDIIEREGDVVDIHMSESTGR